ncbi:hypothetical protein D3Y59_13430 [Hymenobacter oligotrophus]|uniref:Phosphoribosylpyrophosphate synthetase n=2 Tax=Cytophagales TaxID=768507 RepID=A0A3B7RFE8_9BACT|nr:MULTISPECIES: hypothetical protein [Cytophagales]AYA37956.1 hypothetical protein D3Y59_13430 [Hymenobacter oligotrophus]KUG05947.1 hypothetical protein ASU33_00765 [Solirubrum puertoriconensis]
MQDKEEERALVNVERKLTEDGFTSDFNVQDGRLCVIGSETNKTYGPEEVTIVDFYRFEGESNPDDMSILYAIETADGIRGTISNAFGTYADADVDDFLRKVEDLGKNLDKAHK